MSISDRFRSMWNPDDPGSSKPEAAKPPVPPPTPAKPPEPVPDTRAQVLQQLQDVSQALPKEKAESDGKIKELEKEIHGIRLALEKTDMALRNRRDTHQQTLQFLQEDAERELKFLERKLTEDSTSWTRQLSEREKTVEQVSKTIEAEHLERKANSDKEEENATQALQSVEEAVREQEAKLTQERQRWREALQAKEEELVSSKQDLSRREQALEAEAKEQETQRKAAHELWQTRLAELERQWAEKRRLWEEAMKAKEEERLRLYTSLQERQASWQLEQERRLQDMTRRHERAVEKVSALQNHIEKEKQSWQGLVLSREDNIKQLKVKLLLSESEAKSRAEGAEKTLQEAVSAMATKVQSLQKQFTEEQDSWQKALDSKEAEMGTLKENIRLRLRQLESEYAQRMNTLVNDKNHLTASLQTLESRQVEEQKTAELRVQELRDEQSRLETDAQKRLQTLQAQHQAEILALQNQITNFEKQQQTAKLEADNQRREVQAQITARETEIINLQGSILAQETALKTRLGTEEEAVIRQIDSIKSRVRLLDREIVKARESAERLEKDHAAAIAVLQKENEEKETVLRKRTVEQEADIRATYDERKSTLESFIAAKKEEETRLNGILKAKDKERGELAERLAALPAEFDRMLKEKKEAVHKELEAVKERQTIVEAELLEAREASKASMQVKATQLGTLRQAFYLKQKELADDLRNRQLLWETERAGLDKQLAAAQGEMDRIRAHWQAEIDKKVQEGAALQDQIVQQEQNFKLVLEKEHKLMDEQLAPIEKQRQELVQTLQHERLAHAEKLAAMDKEGENIQIQIQRLGEQSQKDHADQESRFRTERAQWKARFEALRSEQEAIIGDAENQISDKNVQAEGLEEQLRQQAVAHEAKKRELIHNATLRMRTLQDIVSQVQNELKTAQEAFPKEMQESEVTINELNKKIASEEERRQKMLHRYSRAMLSLSRRGGQKEELLKSQLAAMKEEWAGKIAEREAEIAALRSSLLAKESEREGELERLAKQFTEERFQLEKQKDELEWKLKDHKEVTERQLANRRKELQFLEAEVVRLKIQRDEQLAQRSQAFETEKQKIQASISTLTTRRDEDRATFDATLADKDSERQHILNKSVEKLKILQQEFDQKVGSWRGTNDALKTQIDQLKLHMAGAQDNWEALQKEKNGQIADLRQEVSQWEMRLQSDYEALERTQDQERQAIQAQLRKKQKETEDLQTTYARRIADKEEELNRALDEMKQKETTAEAQWRATLEQWQTEKQALDGEKVTLENDIVQLQSRSQQELRRIEETSAQLKMDISFKESQVDNQRDRLKMEYERELQPLRDQLAELTMAMQYEKSDWESRIRSKEDDLKVVKTRLAWREKRLQDEAKRQQKELEVIRKQAADEVAKARQRLDVEQRRMDTMLEDRRKALRVIEAEAEKINGQKSSQDNFAKQSLQTQRQHLLDSLQRLEADHVETRKNFEVLLISLDDQLLKIGDMLDQKDHDLGELRKNARELSEGTRKNLETLRQAITRLPQVASGPMGAAAYATFENGVRLYQMQRWAEAAAAFEECLRGDPRWSAAQQYLALVYHALGRDAEAATLADEVISNDPQNDQLKQWVVRLRSSLDLEKKKKAS